MSNEPPKTLSTADYAVFGVTLGISAAIGIFYAIKDRRSNEGTEGYLLGGRSMGIVPVSLSLAVSFNSAITVLGTPAEIYQYGTMYAWLLLTLLIVTIVTGEIFIPMFFRMKITSVYEYIERRFNKIVRIMATIIYILSTILYVGIVIYAPSLALNAVTGFDVWAAVLSTGVVCIFYTALGGFKAVIWTDVFQAIVMLIGFLAITIGGSIDQGGYARVWEDCEEGGRIDFLRIDADPRYRHTVWSIILGGSFYWLRYYGIEQAQVQRYLSCKSEKQAKGAVYMNWLGVLAILGLGMINGTILYSFYRDCDPLLNNEISAYDQLVPYISLNLFQNHPGVTGVIISGVFSGSLSTISTGINSMASVTVQDFVKPYTKWDEKKYIWFSQGAAIVFGALCIGMAFVSSQLGGVLQAAYSINGLISGPLLALFVLGFMFPFVNAFGAFIGVLSGISFSAWIYIGSIIYPPSPEFLRKLELSVEKCTDDNLNTTMNYFSTPNLRTESTVVSTQEPYPEIADMYALSYLYYSFVGFWVAVIVATICSLLSGGWRDRKQIEPFLFYFFFDHWLFSWFPKSFRKFMRCGIDIDGLKEEDESHEACQFNYLEPKSAKSLSDFNEPCDSDNTRYKEELQQSTYKFVTSTKL